MRVCYGISDNCDVNRQNVQLNAPLAGDRAFSSPSKVESIPLMPICGFCRGRVSAMFPYEYDGSTKIRKCQNFPKKILRVALVRTDTHINDVT